MVVKIKSAADFRDKLRYNENKVKQRQAVCIHAANFILNPEQLTIKDKVTRFKHLFELNRYVDHNSVHCYIGMHPDDRPTREKMIQISDDYMRRLGFSEQPYLVYQHLDSGNPHMHILAAAVGPDGNSIQSFRTLQERIALTREMEQFFGLTSSEKKRNTRKLNPSFEPKESIAYGEVQLKDAIANVLEYALPAYNYTSLAELNAILREYRLRADNGKPGGVIREKRGLVYHLLNERGMEKGRGIKASLMDFNPGLAYLEDRFRENQEKSLPGLERISTRVALAMRGEFKDWQGFSDALGLARIQVIPYAEEKGAFYGFVFIDHQTRTVAADTRLGDVFNAGHLLGRMGRERVVERGLALEELDQRTLSRDINRAAGILARERAAGRNTERQRNHLLENEHMR